MESYRGLTEIAKTVREDLKRELPAWRFSVTVKNYSGGGSITLALVSGPLPVMLERDRVTERLGGYAQLNQYTFLSERGYGREQLESNGHPLTAAGFDTLEKATKILAREHWDKSDIQSDYFYCAFYMHVNVGRWDKEYRVVEAVKPVKTKESA